LMSIQHRFAQNYTFLANYTDSYCVSDTDFGAALATPGNIQRFNRHGDYGPCVFDTRHNFNLSLVANSSVKSGNVFVRQLLSGWELAPLIHASSGQPLNVTTGKDNSLSGLNNDRPNLLLNDYRATNAVCNNGRTPCVQYLNPTQVPDPAAAFAPNALGTYGNIGRNELRGPSTVTVDVALSRNFTFKERYSLQVRVDAFNILNHANFVGAISPAGTVTGYSTLSTNLSSTSTFGRVQAAFDPRILQFSMKLRF
jgi:hypothetical protein